MRCDTYFTTYFVDRADQPPPKMYAYDDPRLEGEWGYVNWYSFGEKKKLIRGLGSAFYESFSDQVWTRLFDPVSETDLLAYEAKNPDVCPSCAGCGWVLSSRQDGPCVPYFNQCPTCGNPEGYSQP